MPLAFESATRSRSGRTQRSSPLKALERGKYMVSIMFEGVRIHGRREGTMQLGHEASAALCNPHF